MSTFTDWNGPQGNAIGGLRNADLLSLTKAYNEVLNALNEKQDKLTFDDQLLSTSDNPVKNRVIKAAVDALQEAVDKLKTLLEIETAERKKQDSETVAITDAALETLEDSFKQLDEETRKAIEEANKYIEELEETFGIEEDGVRVKKALKIASYVLESSYIDFRKISAFRAPVSGVSEDQPAFILGMMSSDWEPSEDLEEIGDDYKTKAGRAFLKFVNSKSFDAIADMSASYSGDGWKGALSVTGSNVSAIKQLMLRLVSGTDKTGAKHVWLAVVAGNWTAATPDFYQSLYFYATGINFYPVGSDGYKDPNDYVELIAEASLGNGFSTSALSSDKVTDSDGDTLLEIKTVGSKKRLAIGSKSLNGVKFYVRPYYLTSPLVALEDIRQIIEEIGTVVAWCKFDENGNPVDYPENYLPCDGSEFKEEDYPELYKILGGKLPLVDCHIVKAKNSMELTDMLENKGMRLEDAVAALHGIKVYERMADLPSDAKIGVPAIIRDVDTVTGEVEFFVLVKTASGWEDYSTEFDDYHKTIESIATTIASMHGADVYTLYDSEDNFPSLAEEGETAIVVDGAKAKAYRFSDGRWESLHD